MIDNVCYKLMDSRCEVDYKHRHYWERRGVLLISGYIYVIWQCTQCGFCIRERLRFLTGEVHE